MKTEKLKLNRMSFYIKGFVSFVFICGVIIFGINVLSQTQKEMNNKISAEQKQNQAPDEVQRLIEVLRNDENKTNSPQLITEVIQKLGTIGDERAVPELIKYLDFERKTKLAQNQDPNLLVDSVETTNWDYLPLSSRYPAVGALFQIGKLSLPELVKVVENESIKSQKSQNAVEAIKLIFRDDLINGIEYLEDAKVKSVSLESKQRLQLAVKKVRDEYYKSKEK